jgi:hypothetical protein
MRPRLVIGILAFALIVFALLLWHRPAKQPLASTPPLTQEKQPSLPQIDRQPDDKPTIAAQPSNASSNPATVLNVTTVSSNAAETRELRMKQMVEELNVPVRFYGMVIDQNSNALSGVRVKLGVRHSTYAIPNSLEAVKYAALSQEELQKMLHPTTEVLTDDNGRFQWADSNVTGDILGVASITKDGYEAEPGQYSCGAGSGNFDNPVIFKMWSTNIHEKLISGGKSFDIVPDGRPYFINLTDDTILESGTGDLKVWIQYTSQIVSGHLYDWSAGIEVINGGLLEMPLGTVMFEAPIDGYVPAFQLKGQIKGGQRGDTGERQFYLKLKDGQEYGQMSIDLIAPFNDQTPGLIRLSYAINPSGSRILR